MPFDLSFVPIDPADGHLQEYIKVQYDVLKINRCPPYGILFLQVPKKLNHVAIDDKYSPKYEINIRFDLKFRIEVNLSKKHGFQCMSGQEIADSPLETFIIFSSHGQCKNAKHQLCEPKTEPMDIVFAIR